MLGKALAQISATPICIYFALQCPRHDGTEVSDSGPSCASCFTNTFRP